jgi:thioredoxin 1
VDDCQRLAAQYHIGSIPTLMVFKGGQVQETVVGAKSKRELKAILDRVLAA